LFKVYKKTHTVGFPHAEDFDTPVALLSNILYAHFTEAVGETCSTHQQEKNASKIVRNKENLTGSCKYSYIGNKVLGGYFSWN
jgi:hypothetical protein